MYLKSLLMKKHRATPTTKILTAFSLITIALGFYWLEEEIGSDFSPEYIVNHLVDPTPWSLPTPTLEQKLELQAILNQPFSYLGHGHQTYVFSSQDNQYVLKFFRIHRFKPSMLTQSLAYLPGLQKWTDKREKSRQFRLERIFKGHQTAYLYDRENSGLLYVQLQPSQNLNLQVKVINWLGFSSPINLDEVPFVVQKRARPTKHVLEELLAKGDIAGVQERLQQIIQMYKNEYQKGILDTDHNVIYNTGFVGNQPIRIDVGRLTYDEKIKDPAIYEADLDRIVNKRMLGWLKRHYPEVTGDIGDLEDIKKIYHSPV